MQADARTRAGREEQQSPSGTVCVIDDDDGFRTSMLRLLRAHGLSAVGRRCAGEFLLADALPRPGCILLDISMPGPSGMELLKALQSRALQSRGSAPPVIFITGYDDVLTSVDAIKAGAIDYIVKPASAEKVLHCVHKALQMDQCALSAEKELTELSLRFRRLSAVERTIFLGIASNKLNKQLAVELGVCERTIKTHRARMWRKLQIRSVPDLVRASRLLRSVAEREDRNATASQGAQAR